MRNVLVSTGLNNELIEGVVEILNQNGIVSSADVELFTDKELSTMVSVQPGLNAVGVKKIVKALREAKIEENSVVLPELPEEFNSNITLTINGNLNVPMAALLAYIRVTILSKLGIEDIGKAVSKLVNARLNSLDEPANAAHIKVFTLCEKFRSIDDTMSKILLDKLDIKLGLVNKRHEIINLGDAVLLPSLVKYLNDVMDFRYDISNVDSYMLSKLFGRDKIGADVDYTNLVVATQEFIINTNHVLKGLNTLIIQETYKLYTELFELIQSRDLLEFLGAKDTGDLLRALGITITPRDLKLYEQLPTAVYSLLSVAGSDGEKFKDPQVIYAYLQKVWSVFQTLNLVGLTESRRVDRAILAL